MLHLQHCLQRVIGIILDSKDNASESMSERLPRCICTHYIMRAMSISKVYKQAQQTHLRAPASRKPLPFMML